MIMRCSNWASDQFWPSVIQQRILPLINHLSSFTEPESDGYGIRLIDQELSAIREIECDLRTRRNARTRTCTIPSEILANIFYNIFHPPFTDNLSWIIVTHVCRHWRQVALDHPSLWTNISTALGDRAMIQMLARSKECVPITFEHYGRKCDFQDHILPHLHRVEKLLLHDHSHPIKDILYVLKQGTIPTLKSLTISALGHDFKLPLISLLRANPQLRSVTLLNVGTLLDDIPDLPLRERDEQPIKNLRQLHLNSPGFAYPTINQLLNVLKSFRNLRGLTLSGLNLVASNS